MSPDTPSSSGGSSFVPPTAPELQKLLPKYDILAFIGQGPMGTVYKARQPQLDRLVAIKLFHIQESSDGGFVERFTREAKNMAQLSHPRIVTLHDFGELDRPGDKSGGYHLLYLVTEFVEGDTLERVMEKKRFDQKQVLAIITQICDALKYAHDHGIVHRDIRPNNTMYSVDGQIKVSDFGLAKLMGVDQFHTNLTIANKSMRTMDYIAPEQLEFGREVDHRADVYSIGVMLYKLLAGKLPRGTFVMPSVQNPELDVRLDDIIVTAMQQEPGDRYPDITKLWSEIETVRASPTLKTAKVDAMPPSGGRKLVTGKVTTKQPTLRTGSVTSKVKPITAGAKAAAPATAAAGSGSLSSPSSPSSDAPAGIPIDSTGKVQLASNADSSRKLLLVLLGSTFSAVLLGAIGWMLLKPEVPETITKAETVKRAEKPKPKPQPKPAPVVAPKPAPKPEPEPEPEPAFVALDLPRPTLVGQAIPVVRVGVDEDLSEFGSPPPEAAAAVKVAGSLADTAGFLLLTPEGTVVPWFDPALNTKGVTEPYTKIPGDLSDVVDLAMGNNHAVALKKDGTVVVWGNNSKGQRDVPENLQQVTQIAAGYAFTLALTKDASVFAWGARNHQDKPAEVPADLGPVRLIAAGNDHALAVKQDGTLVGWGRNDHGQARIKLPDGGGEIIAIGAWGADSFILTDKNYLYHFGQTPSEAIPELIRDVLAFVPGREGVAVLTPSGQWDFRGGGNQARLRDHAVGASTVAYGKRFMCALKPAEADYRNWLATVVGPGAAVATNNGGSKTFTGIPGLPGYEEPATPGATEGPMAPEETGAPASPAASPAISISDTEAGKKFQELLDTYREGYEQTILTAFTTEITNLNTGYIKALERTETNIAASGNLDRVIAVRAALKTARAAGEGPIPPGEPVANPPKRLVDLRLAYDKKLGELRGEHDTKLASLLPPLDQNLDALQREFTQQEKIEEALEIRNARAQLQAKGLPFGALDTPAAVEAAAPAMVATAEPSETTPTTNTPAGPPEFPPNAPTDALRITPDGAGDSLTLDEALQKAERGQTLALASGEYPPSAVAKEKYNSDAYQIETPGLTLIGHRAKLRNLVVRADDATLRGLGANIITIGAWGGASGDSFPQDTVLESCRFNLLSGIDKVEISATNCVGAVYGRFQSNTAFQYCTLIPHADDEYFGQHVGREASSRFENCVIAGTPYVIQVPGSGTEDCTVRKCLVAGSRGLVGVEGPPLTQGGPGSIVNVDPREASRNYGIKFTNCIEEDPQFIDQGGGDYRLSANSPGKGQGDNGRDLGARLDADGWPVAP